MTEHNHGNDRCPTNDATAFADGPWLLSALCSVLLTLILCYTAEAETLNTGTTSYTADALRAEGLRANVRISVSQQDGITVNTSGSQELTGLISTNIHNGTLTLRRNKNRQSVGDISVITVGEGGTNKSVVTINGQTTISEGNGIVVVNGRTSPEKLTLEIAVPVGTPLELLDFRGNAAIGNILGPLTIETSGDVKAGEVTRTELRVRGSGDVHIQKVADHLDLEVTGNGDIEIASGDVDALKARAGKNGKARFGGRAVKAELLAKGNAELSVAQVVEQPRIHVSRNGEVNVGNW